MIHSDRQGIGISNEFHSHSNVILSWLEQPPVTMYMGTKPLEVNMLVLAVTAYMLCITNSSSKVSLIFS